MPADSFSIMRTNRLKPVPVAQDDEAKPATSKRASNRFVPIRPNTTVTDGRTKPIRARIINLSATGVAVEADFAQIDALHVTHVGQTRVKAGRKILRGMVYIFEKPLDASRCSETTTL